MTLQFINNQKLCELNKTNVAKHATYKLKANSSLIIVKRSFPEFSFLI